MLALQLLLFVPPQLRPCPELVLQRILAAVFVEFQDHKLAVVDVAQVLKVLDAPMIPLHQKDPGHQTVSDQNAYTCKVLLPEQPPH